MCLQNTSRSLSGSKTLNHIYMYGHVDVCIHTLKPVNTNGAPTLH